MAVENGSIAYTEASLVLLEINGKFLFLKKRTDRKDSVQGKWVLPGGHIDAGESASETAIRETMEETGLQLMHVELVGVLEENKHRLHIYRSTVQIKEAELVEKINKIFVDKDCEHVAFALLEPKALERHVKNFKLFEEMPLRDALKPMCAGDYSPASMFAIRGLLQGNATKAKISA